MGVSVAVTRVAANTSTGTQDITTTDLGGLTPKAVLLIATRAVTDGTIADGAGFYVGASDGTNEWTEGYESEHGQASMDSDHQQDTTANRILTIYDGTADAVVEATADFSAFISNGVTIDWTDAPASAFLVTAVFFAGTDLSANVGTVALGNTADALIAVTSVGFEADVLITALLEGTTTGNPNLGMGVVHNDRAGTVTQRSIAHKQRNGFSSGFVGSMMRDGECVTALLATDTLDYYGAAQSFDSSGFDIQLGNGREPINRGMGWIALRFGTSPVVESKVYTYSTPTATGSNTDSTPNFEPQFVMYLPTRAAAADTIESDSDGGTVGVLVADGDEVYTNSIGDDDGNADSNTQSMSDDQLNLPTDDGAAGHEATLTSMGSTGPVWNYSATDGTARLWAALAIEVSGASEITGTLSKTLGALASSTAGTVDVTGTFARTLGLTTQSATQVDVTALVDETLAALASTAAAQVTVTATLAKTLGALLLASAGNVEIGGTASIILGSLLASGAVTVDVSGGLGSTLGALSGDGSGDVDVSGLLGLTLASLTSSASGSVDVTAALIQTLGALVSSASGEVTITGELAQTLGALLLAAAGTVGDAGEVTAALAVTLGSLAILSSGSVDVDSTLAKALSALGISGAGSTPVDSTLAKTLGNTILLSSANVDVGGIMGVIFGNVTGSGSGSVTVSADTNKTLGALVSSTAGSVTVTGTLSQVLSALLLVAVGATPIPGYSQGGLVSVRLRRVYKADDETYEAEIRRSYKA